MESDDKVLIDEYEKLQHLKDDLESNIKRIRQRIIELAKQKDTNALFGTSKGCSIKEYEKVVYPENKEPLIALIKSKGLYDQFSSLNYFKLGPKIIKNEIDSEIIKLVTKEKAYRVALFDKNRVVVG